MEGPAKEEERRVKGVKIFEGGEMTLGSTMGAKGGVAALKRPMTVMKKRTMIVVHCLFCLKKGGLAPVQWPMTVMRKRAMTVKHRLFCLA